MDTLALSRTGYPKATTGCDISTLDNEVFTTSAEPFNKGTTSTWSGASFNARGSSARGDGGSTSTLEDEFEDLTEIINAELTKLDREIVSYVANGEREVMSTPQMPDANLDNMLNSGWMGGFSSNGTTQSGLPLGAPKSEPISVDEEVDFNEPNIQTPSIPNIGELSQTLGNLPVGSYPDDTKPSVVPMEQDNVLFQLSSSKMRGVNSPCMFSNANAAAERNFQQNVPPLSHMNAAPGNASLMSMSQQMQSVPTARNVKDVKTSGVPTRNAAYPSNPQAVTSRRVPHQRPGNTSTITSATNQNEPQLQIVQLLKEAIPENLSYTDEMVVDLVDDMIVDRDEAQRLKDDLRLASILQQGGYMQPERFIKQEVVTPTLAQPTFSFPTVSNSMATQNSQAQMMSSSTLSLTGTYTSTNTNNQLPGNKTSFGGTSRRPQNGTVNNQDTPANFQNGNSQFMNQEDSNMNFLNSVSNGGLTNNHGGLSVNMPWNSNPLPKPNAMQQGLRTLLQSPAPSQSTNSGMLSQPNMPFLPQENVNAVPSQNDSRITQGNSFNLTMLQNMSQLDALLQSAHLPASGFNFNGSNMSFSNQSYPKFDMNRKL